ncbi:MAG: hypothetical protein FRX48_06891 [Lasallia pustulata]|uniref:Uncharacterized protein n=1 Tax=Lasallia pustulata TaxID=136370 RepID=A0A5M8PKD7_9LECA|nr:MAG: hypothetical protein FRX48_06891 [Lasallia pustulata]
MNCYKSKMSNGHLCKWEDNNHGLEHKCGTCKTPLSSPKAKITCLEKHQEACTKYHKTVFFLGSSHKCDACRKSMELHDKRHREIAAIVQKILGLEGTIIIASLLSTKKRKSRKRETSGLRSTATNIVDPKMIEGVEESADSSTICKEESDIKKLRTPNTKENRNTKKAQKGEKKIVNNQRRVQIISSEDVEQISRALHPSRTSLVGESHVGSDENGNGQGLLNNSTVDANKIFNDRTFKYASLRPNIGFKKAAKAQGISTPKTPDDSVIWQEDPQIVEILGRLNVDVVAGGPSSRERKTLLSKLCYAIHNDLLIQENEDRDTMMRMAGYWRYVNKRTYNAMVRNNQLWDWATGAELEEVDEEEEEEDAEVNEEYSFPGPDTARADADGRDIFAENDNKKGLAEGEFEGKADTRHLTSTHHRASSPSEPVSADLPYQSEKAIDGFLYEEDGDAFLYKDEDVVSAAEEKGREHHNKHHDYDHREDLAYSRQQPTNHQPSNPRSLPRPPTPILRLTIPNPKPPNAAPPRTQALTAPTLRAKTARPKPAPVAGDGASYAAVARAGLRK